MHPQRTFLGKQLGKAHVVLLIPQWDLAVVQLHLVEAQSVLPRGFTERNVLLAPEALAILECFRRRSVMGYVLRILGLDSPFLDV